MWGYSLWESALSFSHVDPRGSNVGLQTCLQIPFHIKPSSWPTVWIANDLQRLVCWRLCPELVVMLRSSGNFGGGWSLGAQSPVFLCLLVTMRWALSHAPCPDALLPHRLRDKKQNDHSWEPQNQAPTQMVPPLGRFPQAFPHDHWHRF